MTLGTRRLIAGLALLLSALLALKLITPEVFQALMQTMFTLFVRS